MSIDTVLSVYLRVEMARVRVLQSDRQMAVCRHLARDCNVATAKIRLGLAISRALLATPPPVVDPTTM